VDVWVSLVADDHRRHAFGVAADGLCIDLDVALSVVADQQEAVGGIECEDRLDRRELVAVMIVVEELVGIRAALSDRIARQCLANNLAVVDHRDLAVLGGARQGIVNLISASGTLWPDDQL